MLISPSQQNAKIERLEIELGEARRTVDSTNREKAQATTVTTAAQKSVIVNLIRNGDHSHSVDTWFNESGTDAPLRSSGGNPEIVGGTF